MHSQHKGGICPFDFQTDEPEIFGVLEEKHHPHLKSTLLAPKSKLVVDPLNLHQPYVCWFCLLVAAARARLAARLLCVSLLYLVWSLPESSGYRLLGLTTCGQLTA